jgi:D-alanine-D-alanine ligase
MSAEPLGASVHDGLDMIEEFGRAWAGATVGVVHGARSAEDRVLEQVRRGVSLEAITSSLAAQGFHPVHLDPTEEKFIDALASVDLVFLNVHGEFGEDGRIQGLLDYLSKPYTGSGVRASAIGVHKVSFKRMITAAGLPTPQSAAWGAHSRDPHTSDVAALSLPVLAKPVNGGSSLGIQLIPDEKTLEAFMSRHVDDAFFLEQFLRGRSLTVAVLQVGSRLVASPPLETQFAGAFYDARIKLDVGSGGLVSYATPDITEGLRTRLSCAALEVHSFLGCHGFSRADFVVDHVGAWHVLEINTNPGMTRSGNFASCLACLGFTYDQVVLAMLASCAAPRRG